MAQQDGDFFRNSRFGGFHKEDVMQYIEGLKQRLHEQTQLHQACDARLRESRQEQLRWMDAARLQRRRGSAANQVRQELRQFQRELAQAHEMLAEIERENHFLREKIHVLEDDTVKEEPASIPLEQLTFKLFLDSLEEEDDEDYGVTET